MLKSDSNLDSYFVSQLMANYDMSHWNDMISDIAKFVNIITKIGNFNLKAFTQLAQIFRL